MNHEQAIKKIDTLFKENKYTAEEERFAKATMLSVLARSRVFDETGSEHVDYILGHTFGSMLGILAVDVNEHSATRITDAVNFFIGEINNEHRKSS